MMDERLCGLRKHEMVHSEPSTDALLQSYKLHGFLLLVIEVHIQLDTCNYMSGDRNNSNFY